MIKNTLAIAIAGMLLLFPFLTVFTAAVPSVAVRGYDYELDDARVVSQTSLPPSLKLLGGGAKWAAGNGSSALFVNWKDSWLSHHLTDGSTWGPWPAEWCMDDRRFTVSSALNQSGLNVEFAGDIPQDLTRYDVVVIQAYWAAEPKYEPLIRNYIFNGGGIVILSGVPPYFGAYCKDWWASPTGGSNLSPIQEWFGGGYYGNEDGYANIIVDNPFGTGLREGNVVFTGNGPNPSIASFDNDAQVIAKWSWSSQVSGGAFAFTHKYGQGRVYFQSFYESLQTSVTPPATNPPTSRIPTMISISTSSPSTFVGFAVEVYGTLQDIYENYLTNQLVVLHYTFPGFGTWIPITSGTTDQLGRFNIAWIPPATGYFTLKAEWKGNVTHTESSNTISLNTVPYKSEYVFSVESNSTISALAFNSTSLNLSFILSDQSGTRGYLKVTMAKSLVANIADVKVFLDGNEMQYSAASFGESWLLNFTYTHSTHYVAISFLSVQQRGFLGSSVPVEYGYAIVSMTALALIAAIGYLVYKRRKQPQQPSLSVKHIFLNVLVCVH